MWDSPAWLGSAISAKVKKDSDAATRLNQYNIAKEDREARIAMQESINTTQSDIAEKDRTSRESIESANRSNALAVAFINAASHAVPKLLPLVIGKGFLDNNNGRGSTNNSGTGVTAGSTSSVSVTDAQKKVDNAFPTLEPTFRDRVKDIVNVTGFGSHVNTINSLTTATGVGVLSQMMLPIFI